MAKKLFVREVIEALEEEGAAPIALANFAATEAEFAKARALDRFAAAAERLADVAERALERKADQERSEP